MPSPSVTDTQRTRLRLPLKVKLSLLITGLVVLSVLLVGFFLVRDEQQNLTLEMTKRGSTIAENLAAGAKSALEQALRISLVRADKRIGSGHILLALLRTEAGTVPRALKEAGVDRAELNDRVAAAKLG